MAAISSKCGVYQLVDWGKNDDNIIDFMREYNVQWLTANNQDLEAKYDLVKAVWEAEGKKR